MGEEPTKLFTHKPKKSQIKQFRDQKAKDFSSPVSSSSSSQSPPISPPPPSSSVPSHSQSPPPKESFVRRYRFLWPMLLTVNLAVGAYLFMRTKDKKKEDDVEDEAVTQVQTTEATAVEKPLPLPAVKEPVKLRDPIPENQQRELLKWMLEEKRKVKPQDAEQKKRIDEEKALLKQLLRGKSLPSI